MNQFVAALSVCNTMSLRIGLKRLRRCFMRMGTKSYIRLITVFVIAGIFISEGSMKDFSYVQNAEVTSNVINPEHDDESRASSESEKEIQNGSTSFSSPKVSRTLNEILQESIPEHIFGFSNQDRNMSDERKILNSSAVVKGTTLEKAILSDGPISKRQVVPVRYLNGNNSSNALLPTTKEKSQVYLNRTELAVNTTSTRRTMSRQNQFKGVIPTEDTKHLFETDNVTHLSFMLYRLIKTHNIKTVLDVPCKLSMLWMGDLLRILEFEVPKFHYKCLTPDDKTLAEGVVRFQHLSSATVLKNERPWGSRLPRADLALCWYGLGFFPPHQSWALLKALRTAGVKFVIVPNYPDVRHNPGSGSRLGRINVRRAPYRFGEPLRVVNNISTQTSAPKQLLFYDIEGVRRDAL